MFVQIDQFRSSFSAGNSGADYEIGRRYKCDHGAVVIGVRLPIKQHRPRNRFDSGNDLIDDFSTTPFAEIRDTLNDTTHAENPNRLVFGLQKIQTIGGSVVFGACSLKEGLPQSLKDTKFH